MQPGDEIKVTTKDETIQGILLPRPELLKGDFLIVKLDTGYNIGIDKKKIKKTEVIRKAKKPKSFAKKLKPKKGLPNISILSLGGTISSKIDYRTGGVYADLTAEDFVQMCPELADIANIKAKKVMSMMSEDALPSDWIEIAKHVHKELEKADGVVVTQGTDTLHYTTAALSFFLNDLSKPVIFTASQRSIDRGSSDAFMNLICAVKAAAQFDGAGVFTCMHATTNDDYCYLIRGTKVRKMHSHRRDAFRAINEKPIAKVPKDDRIVVINENYTKKGEGKTGLNVKFESKTALIYFHPGMEPDIIDHYLKKGYKGIVIAGTAFGHVATFNKRNWLQALENAKKKKVPVVMTTQCLYGRVDPLVYSPLRKLSIEKQVIFAEDMLPETAFVKLGWVLAQAKDKVKEMMLTNYAGEIQDSLAPDVFLE